MLTDLQKKKITRLFNVVDSDRNGVLEKSDIERVSTNLCEGRGWKSGEQKWEALKARYAFTWQQVQPFADKDKVSLEKFIEYHDKMLNIPGAYDATVKAMTDFIFDALDSDGDGKITLAENKAFYKAYGIDEKEADKVFPKLDLNADGHISRAELTDLVTQFFFGSDPEAPGNWLFGQF